MLERDALGHCVNNVFLLDFRAGSKVFTKNFLELFFAKLRGLMNVQTTFFSKMALETLFIPCLSCKVQSFS